MSLLDEVIFLLTSPLKHWGLLSWLEKFRCVCGAFGAYMRKARQVYIIICRR
jgi:hypothetical protein